MQVANYKILYSNEVLVLRFKYKLMILSFSQMHCISVSFHDTESQLKFWGNIWSELQVWKACLGMNSAMRRILMIRAAVWLRPTWECVIDIPLGVPGLREQCGLFISYLICMRVTGALALWWASADERKLMTVTGALALWWASADERKLLTVTGALALWRASADERKLLTVTGALALWRVSADERKLLTVTGALALWRVSADERKLLTVTGALALWRASADERKLLTVTGALALWGASADERKLLTVTGALAVWWASADERKLPGKNLLHLILGNLYI